MTAKYTVRIDFVDDSYWDDGSRWTYQIFKFDNQKDAIAFAQEASTKGCKLQGQYKELFGRPDKESILVERHYTTKVKWE